MNVRFTRWIIFNIILFSVGIGLGAGHYPIDFDGLRCPTYEGNSTLSECFQFGALLGMITGLAIGIGQALILRNQLGLNRNRFIGWVAATTLAFSLGHAIGDSAPVPQFLPYSAVVQGLLSGAMLGGMQWLVLRGKLEDASHWVWRSAIGFGIGLGLVGFAAMLLLDASRNSIWGLSGGIDVMVFVALDGLLVGGFWAAATGRVLWVEMDRPQ